MLQKQSRGALVGTCALSVCGRAGADLLCVSSSTASQVPCVHPGAARGWCVAPGRVGAGSGGIGFCGAALGLTG